MNSNALTVIDWAVIAAYFAGMASAALQGAA